MRAGVYARISSDPSGQALGVRRQLEDCRDLVAQEGWTVAGEYVDNDRSAHSGTPRPEYDRLLADVADGLIDAVVVWDLDRLHRRPKELEEFIEVCDKAGMKRLRTVQGTGADIGTTDGLFLARIMGAVAAAESDKKSQRVKRKMRQNAQAGKPHGGSRAFGFEPDKVTIKPEEARIVRDLASRLLAGESLQSLAKSLADAEVPTVNGGQWRPSTVRNMLYNARLSGQREHKGQIIGDAVWDPIITKEQTEKIRALLDDPRRKTARSARRYLLAGGLLVCHRCGTGMVSNPRHGVRRYICKNDANITGCGRTYINADPLEQLIYEAVLIRLDSPELADALRGKHSASADAVELSEALEQAEQELEELAAMHGEGEISVREWKAAREPIAARRDRARRDLARATQTTAIDGLVGEGSKLRQSWDSLNLSRQQSIVRTVLDHAVIGPGRSSAQAFEPDRVSPVWRL